MRLEEKKALDLASKIVTDILADPAHAEDMKLALAATLTDAYNSGANQGTADQLDKVKHYLTSKTFWGVTISLFAHFSPKLGLKIGSDQATAWASNLGDAAGALLAFYGRFVAKENLTWKTKTSE